MYSPSIKMYIYCQNLVMSRSTDSCMERLDYGQILKGQRFNL